MTIDNNEIVDFADVPDYQPEKQDEIARSLMLGLVVVSLLAAACLWELSK